MSDETFPDIEGALRTFLRANAGVAAIVAQRVFFGVPKQASETTFPMVSITRVGGGDDPSVTPLDRALIQIDCWGGIDASGNGRKAEATSLVNAVRSALRTVDGRTSLASGVRGFGANVESVVWLPDPDNDRPRYAVTAEVTAVSA